MTEDGGAVAGPDSSVGTGSSVAEATATALTLLGVSAADADIEVVEAPRRGLFSGRRPAKVRATRRTAPNLEPATTPRPTDGDAEAPGGAPGAAAEPEPHTDTHPNDRPTQGDAVTDTSTDTQDTNGAGEPEEELTPEQRLELLDEEAEIAADFVEGLLDLLGLPGDIEIVVREEQAIINVSEVGSGLLIGRRGATLDALQELVRCATQRRTERRSHVRVDVEGYRERQLEKLRDKCREAIAEVREHGEPVRLEPMDPYERKMMHDVVAKASGVTSTSEGNEPRRRVVIHSTED